MQPREGEAWLEEGSEEALDDNVPSAGLQSLEMASEPGARSEPQTLSPAGRARPSLLAQANVTPELVDAITTASIRAVRERRYAKDRAIWEIGRQPRNDAEWELEIKFREMRLRERTEQEERQDRLRRMMEADKLESGVRREQLDAGRRADNVRSLVLLLVILAIVVMPVWAMLASVSPESFAQYLAPVTGIAGTIIGYWFGQRSSKTEMPSSSLPPPELRP